MHSNGFAFCSVQFGAKERKKTVRSPPLIYKFKLLKASDLTAVVRHDTFFQTSPATPTDVKIK